MVWRCGSSVGRTADMNTGKGVGGGGRGGEKRRCRGKGGGGGGGGVEFFNNFIKLDRNKIWVCVAIFA